MAIRPRSSPRLSIWTVLTLATGMALPATTLGDHVLADSYSFRVKARVLSVGEIFTPDVQKEVVNPYYRPLFIVLQEAFDAVFEESSFGLRLLAILCHLFAASALVALGRTLGLPAAPLLCGLVLFCFNPGNIATAAWPVVGYWTLSAAFTFLAARSLLEYCRHGGWRKAAAFLFLSFCGLLASQTPYHLVAFAGLCWVFPLQRTRRSRPRALLLLFLGAALVVVHFDRLSSVSGLASGSYVDRATKALQCILLYFSGSLGDNCMVGLPWIAPWLGAMLLPGLIAGQRRHWFLLCFAALAPLPFAGLGHSERYAYFASGPFSLLLASLCLEGWPEAARMIRAPSLGRLAGAGLFFGLLGVHVNQSSLRLNEMRTAASDTRSLDDDLDAILPTIRNDLSATGFINLPRMTRLSLFDRLHLQTVADLRRAEQSFLPINLFVTDGAYFGKASFAAEPDPSRNLRHLLYCDGLHLEAMSPAAPLAPRRAYLEPVFFARDFEVFAPPPDLPSDRRRSRAFKVAFLEVARTFRDPEEKVLIEARVGGLDRPLAVGRVDWQFIPGPAPAVTEEQSSIATPRFLGRLKVRTGHERPALLVVVAYTAAEDPVARVTGTEGRCCDLFTATLDGAEVRIVPVFYHLTGVVVPPGSHEVEVFQR